MGTWGTSIFSDDLACDVRNDYNALLSIKKDGDAAEKALLDYYADILNCNKMDEDVFWFSLALSDPCFGKYVLLRIIKIKKQPFFQKFESEYYNEIMLVGLYDWIGENIPLPDITDQEVPSFFNLSSVPYIMTHF